MKKILPICSLLLLIGSLTSQAQMYVGTDLVYDMDDNETGFAVNLGYDFEAGTSFSSNSTHGIELETTFFSGQETVMAIEIDADITLFMVNYQYTSDFLNDDYPLYFYVGAGAGLSLVDVSVAGFGSDDDSSFAVQGFLGLGYELNNSMSLEIGYRRVQINGPTLYGVESDDLDSDLLQLGFKFNF